MNFRLTVEHDEDDLPTITFPKDLIPPRRDFHDTYQPANPEHDYPTRLIGNWQTLYQASLQSLQCADDEPQPTTDKPYYFGRQTSPPYVPSERVTCASRFVPTSGLSPLAAELPPPSHEQPKIESDTSAPKWQIRLPELLNGTVGPDRQKRNGSRRHTTTVVFQVPDRRNSEVSQSTPGNSRIEDEHAIAPIVKQLRQKFDRMSSEENLSVDRGRSASLSSWGSRSRIIRTSSLTCRSLTADMSERPVRTPRAMLPVRPTAELTTVKSRSASTVSLHSQTPSTNGRASRERSGPPVSYPKHFYPPPSTTTVVKQLLDGGAALVYDSTSHPSTSHRRSSASRQTRSIDSRADDLPTIDTAVPSRYFPPDSSSDTYAKVKPRAPVRPSNGAGPDNAYCEPIARRSSSGSSTKAPYPSAWRSAWNGADDESANYYAVYDMNI